MRVVSVPTSHVYVEHIREDCLNGLPGTGLPGTGLPGRARRRKCCSRSGCRTTATPSTSSICTSASTRAHQGSWPSGRRRCTRRARSWSTPRTICATRTARSTVAYLIVRDQAHENAYAKALETLGIDWNKTLPIPKTNAEKFPEVKKLLDLGLQSKQYSFSLDNLSEAGRIFQGLSPSKDGTALDASEQMPAGVPMEIAVERPEELAPGLDSDLVALIQATAEMEMAEVAVSFGPVG